MQSIEAFIGPLPHPSVLRKYEQILPGSAERILIMAEKEQDKRHERVSKDSDGLIDISNRGQTFALTVCLTALTISGVLGITGHDAIGSIIGGLDLVALAVVFISGRQGSSPKE
ncbi:MAG: DUF2335 domain-containing protein [Chlorobiaceae bacterium]